jgi:PAS domain S-box-containing protein
VKGFQPWNWVIGTGIYIEDVKEEINRLERRLIHISLLITAIIIAILFYIIRQSLRIENKRRDVEDKLKLSREKYKSLVEASTEGTLMIVDGEIIFSNVKFSHFIGYNVGEVTRLNFDELFEASWQEIVQSIDDPQKSVSVETRIKSGKNKGKDVVLSVSKVKHGESDGYIVVAKEVSPQQAMEKETENLSRELETALLLMNQPVYNHVRDVVTCSIDSSIEHVINLMTRKERDIVFVSRENTVIGVITESDLKKRVLAKNMNVQKPALEIMSSPIVSISENAFLYQALLEIKKNNVSHLGITNTKGEIIGEISEKDLLNIQSNTISNLIHESEKAEDRRELKAIHAKLPVLVNALIEGSTKTRNITSIITSLADAITRRIIELAIEEIGKPPCEFAFMAMGSEGRMEQTLKTDQDNAIVFEDQKDGNSEEAYRYFQKLGEKISNDLDFVGYEFCEGDIMAKNPKWTQPLSVWKEYFTFWINSSDPESILDSSIFFDFRCIYGNEEFIASLRQHVNQHVENKPVFFYHMAQSIIKFKPPLSFFGNIVGNHQSADENNIDIKKILLPVTGFIRVYALQNKLNETNSLLRLKQLHQQKIMNKSMYDELLQSYNFLMYQRLRFQSKNILNENSPDNKVNIDKLTHIEVTTLKKVLNEISNFQSKLNLDFKGE